MIIGYHYKIDLINSLHPSEDPVFALVAPPVINKLPTWGRKLESYYVIVDLDRREIGLNLGLKIKSHRLPNTPMMNIIEYLVTHPLTLMGDFDGFSIVLDESISIYDIIARATLQTYTLIENIDIVEEKSINIKLDVYPEAVTAASLRCTRLGYDALTSLIVSTVFGAWLNPSRKRMNTLSSMILTYIYKNLFLGRLKQRIKGIKMTTRAEIADTQVFEKQLSVTWDSISKILREGGPNREKDIVDKIIVNTLTNKDILKYLFGSYLYPKTPVRRPEYLIKTISNLTAENLLKSLGENIVKLGEHLTNKISDDKDPAIHITSQFNLFDLYIAARKINAEIKKEEKTVYALITPQTIRLFHILQAIMKSMHEEGTIRIENRDDGITITIKDQYTPSKEKIKISLKPVLIPSTRNPLQKPIATLILQKTQNILAHRNLPVYLTQ